jgi:hypothetical protein
MSLSTNKELKIKVSWKHLVQAYTNINFIQNPLSLRCFGEETTRQTLRPSNYQFILNNLTFRKELIIYNSAAGIDQYDASHVVDCDDMVLITFHQNELSWKS